LEEVVDEDDRRADHAYGSRLLTSTADDGPTPEDGCRTSELNDHLRHLTTQLSPTLLKTFQLREVEGWSTRETAQILGIPNGTVKAQLARARKKLKQLMRQALRPRSRNLTDAYVQDVAA
jgi:RNA polymerase sigma-70 factor (ECF subfamily)